MIGWLGWSFGKLGYIPSLGAYTSTPPAQLLLSSSQVSESATVGTVVGTFSVIEGSGVYTYSLTEDTDAKFAIVGNELRVNAALDFETDFLHPITVTATNGIAPVVQAFMIVVLDVDDTAPTILTDAAQTVDENAVFSITLTASEAVTWTKTGGADAALFTLSGDLLSLAAKNFEVPTDADANNTYVVQVTATDATLNAANKTITVTVLDVFEDVSGVSTFYWLGF